MLNNATGFDRIYIACGYTDLRQGIDGLMFGSGGNRHAQVGKK